MSAVKTKPTETAESLKARIRAHHSSDPRLAPEWAVMTEVASRTGGGGGDTRYADAIAMNLWPSRGLAIHGFEVKVYRGDWMRELKNPEKAEAIHRFCDYWWIVAPDGVVLDGELPEGWGLLSPNNGARLRVVTKAAKVAEPTPAGRGFLAAMLRRAVQQTPDVLAINAAVKAERERLDGSYRDRLEREKGERLAAEQVVSSINRGVRLAGGSGTVSRFSSTEELIEVGRLVALSSEPARLARRVEALTGTVIEQATRLIEQANTLQASLTPPEPAPIGPTADGRPAQEVK